MKIENRIEYLTEQRLLAYIPQAIKWVVHYLRAVKRERAIAKYNDQVMRKIRSGGEAIKLEMGSGGKKGVNGWTTVDRLPGSDLRIDLWHHCRFETTRWTRFIPHTFWNIFNTVT